MAFSEQRRQRARDGERGFTIIELIIVSAVIGILAAIAIPQYSTYKQSALDADAKSNLHNMATAMEAYFTSSGSYSGATLALLIGSYGYRQSSDVSAAIVSATGSNYVITAATGGGTGVFTLDSALGVISGS